MMPNSDNLRERHVCGGLRGGLAAGQGRIAERAKMVV
jgi:hypothetical protein